MHYSSLMNEKKSKYLKRKDKLDKNFVWTEEAIQNLFALNKDLTLLQ